MRVCARALGWIAWELPSPEPLATVSYDRACAASCSSRRMAVIQSNIDLHRWGNLHYTLTTVAMCLSDHRRSDHSSFESLMKVDVTAYYFIWLFSHTFSHAPVSDQAAFAPSVVGYRDDTHAANHVFSRRHNDSRSCGVVHVARGDSRRHGRTTGGSSRGGSSKSVVR